MMNLYTVAQCEVKQCMAIITGYYATSTNSIKLICAIPASSVHYTDEVSQISCLWLFHLCLLDDIRRSLVATNRTAVPLTMDQFYLIWLGWRNIR